jgi:hypothetical protein
MEFSKLLVDKISAIKDNKIATIILDKYDDIYDAPFDYINTGSRNDLISFLPESKQEKASENGDEWSDYRNEVKVGRFVKQFLHELGDITISYTDQDVEDFVNKFKAASTNENYKFEIVEGEDIRTWYLDDNYVECGYGSLMDSCMKDEYKQKYLSLYAKNKKQIKLVCLIDKESDLLMGRALLWTLDESPSPSKLFMDRVYVAEEYLFELFKQKAEEEEWMYKANQSNDIARGQEFIHKGKKYQGLAKVKLSKWRLSYYPYVDSMTFFNEKKGVLLNRGFKNAFQLRSVDGDGSNCCDSCSGKWEYDCDDCYGEDTSCENCEGKGVIKCEECNFG